MNYIEVYSSPKGPISALSFSPATESNPKNLLVAGSWDGTVRRWEVEPTGKTIRKTATRKFHDPVLDVAWHDSGTKVFIASSNNGAYCENLDSYHTIQVAQHYAPIRTCHWIKESNYTHLITGSLDKTLQFWDLRQPDPAIAIELPEKCYCADVDYPVMVVGMAGYGLIIYLLDGGPREFRRLDSPLQYENRCVTLFRDEEKSPVGYALGSAKGGVAIQYVDSANPSKDNYIFRCHKSKEATADSPDIFADINDIAVHPIYHDVLAIVGSDGTYSFWDKNARTQLIQSQPMKQAISRCCFSQDGQLFAHNVGTNWVENIGKLNATYSNLYERRIPLRQNPYFEFKTEKKNHIFVKPCFDELNSKTALWEEIKTEVPMGACPAPAPAK